MRVRPVGRQNGRGETLEMLSKYKISAIFLLDDRLAKFTSPTICINMIIGSSTTLLEGVTDDDDGFIDT